MSTRRRGASASAAAAPHDVLVNILGRLRTLHDILAARAVCRDWRNAASISLHSKMFLIIILHNGVETLCDLVSRRFFDLPAIHPGHQIKGFSATHIVTTHGGNVHLWNLLTGTKTVLPNFRCRHSTRIALSDQNQIVIYTPGSSTLRHLNAGGDTSWSVVGKQHWMRSVCDIMFFQGQWLALTKDMSLLAVELAGNSLTVRELGGIGEVVRARELFICCLEESDGVLFAVSLDARSGCDVFRWDSERKVWEETRDVGDNALFVSKHGDSGFVPATLLGLRKNCVYSPNNESGLWQEGPWEEFSLDDMSRRNVPGFRFLDFRH